MYKQQLLFSEADYNRMLADSIDHYEAFVRATKAHTFDEKKVGRVSDQKKKKGRKYKNRGNGGKQNS